MRLSHVHAIVKWLEEFEKVKVLGVGGSGIVYELLHKTNGQRFAMKEIEIKNKSQMEMVCILFEIFSFLVLTLFFIIVIVIIIFYRLSQKLRC